MRLFIIFIEIILALSIALLYAQKRAHLLQSTLQGYGITLSTLTLTAPNCALFSKLSYQRLPIANEIELCLDYGDLFSKRLHLLHLHILRANLNSIQKLLKPSHGSSKQSEWSFLVDRLHLSAIYRYKGLNEISIQAKDINESFAKIDHLAINSFAGTMRASGIYKRTLHLQGAIHPKGSYLASYIRPLNPSAIKKVDFTLVASQKEASFTLSTHASHIYKSADANLSVKGFYRYRSKQLQSNLLLQARYQKSLCDANATITYQQKLSFKGLATVHNKPYNLPIKPSFYKKISLHFIGTPTSIRILASNPYIHAIIQRRGQKISFSTSPIALKDLFKLPKKLQTSYLSISGTYEQNLSLHLDSDLATGELRLAKKELIALLHPRNTPLLHLHPLDPLSIKANLKEKQATITSPIFQASITPHKADISIAKSHWQIEKKRHIHLKATISSIQALLRTLSQLYPIPLQTKVDLRANLQASLDPKNLTYTFSLTSPFEPKSFIHYLSLQGHGEKERLFIDYYAIALAHHSFYATKRSQILFSHGIRLNPFWIEDSIKIKGDYKEGRGHFRIKAHDYTYSSIEGRLRGDIDLEANIKANDLFIQGNLKLKGGVITFKPSTNNAIQDPDIIVVDRPQPKHSNYFTDHVALDIKIDTLVPIRYKLNNLTLLLQPDILVWKELQKKLELLGSLHIPKGLYTPLGEKYTLTKSELYFYGNPTKPFLQLHIQTKKENYTIYITVTGTLDNPILHLESVPYLPPNEILPLLLFNAKSSSLLLKTAGGGRLLGMFSNIFLKNMLSNLGIHLDTLSFTTSNGRFGFEIGKKIGNKITILYKNDAVSTIIVRYEITPHLQSEAIFSPQKSGIDFYYREIR